LVRVRTGLKKFKKAQMTQYPAATPKAKAATIVSRSMVERRNVVINVLFALVDAAKFHRRYVENPAQAFIKLWVHAAEPSILMLPLYPALTPDGINH
jgi:hypothetical protein